VQDLAPDRVIDLGLERVAGDHQVGGPAADVDAGEAKFLAVAGCYLLRENWDKRKSSLTFTTRLKALGIVI